MSDQLTKVDMGPYASRIYKFGLFDDGEHYMEGNNALKFLHFNNTEMLQYDGYTKAHKQKMQSRTVAALALSPNAIRKTVADFLLLDAGQELSIPMAVDVTLVSLDDMYNRSVGREQAVRAMAEIDVKVVDIHANETHVYVNLAPIKGVALTLRLNRKTGFSSVLGKIVGSGRE
jgi:hypothetical protein